MSSLHLDLNEIFTFNFALDEWISNVIWWAAADRIVIVNLTLGINATRSRTWIVTLLSDACLEMVTFRVGNTFRAAVWWCAYVIRNA